MKVLKIRRRFGRAKVALTLFLLIMLILPAGTGLTLLLPSADGTQKAKSGAVIDYSNANRGYVMVKRESKKTQKFAVAVGKEKYTYDINGAGNFDTIPLQMGDGTYKFVLFENATGNQYAKVMGYDLKVKLDDENLPFLYPNIMVDYNADTQAVALAEELCEGLTTDRDKFDAVSKFVKTNIVYDFVRAGSVLSGTLTQYIPDIDDVLDTKKGICFDYAALVACMLRSQGVPTKLVMGFVVQEGRPDTEKIYHAWNQVSIDGNWAVYDPTFAASGAKAKKDGRTSNFFY